MKERIIKPVVLAALCLMMITIVVLNACNKSGSSYGNNGGNNSGNTVSIKGFAFSAATLTIAPNTTVTWTNNDGVAHTVTADDGSFDSGSITPGATFSHKFTSVGTVAYHCTIHPMMTAKIEVSN